LRINDQGPDRCEVAMTLHTEHEDADQVRQEMEEAVAAITHTASADSDIERAQSQKGWA
jgi:hypothetical protein